jgi:hypothetical protein
MRGTTYRSVLKNINAIVGRFAEAVERKLPQPAMSEAAVAARSATAHRRNPRRHVYPHIPASMPVSWVPGLDEDVWLPVKNAELDQTRGVPLEKLAPEIEKGRDNPAPEDRKLAWTRIPEKPTRERLVDGTLIVTHVTRYRWDGIEDIRVVAKSREGGTSGDLSALMPLYAPSAKMGGTVVVCSSRHLADQLASAHISAVAVQGSALSTPSDVTLAMLTDRAVVLLFDGAEVNDLRLSRVGARLAALGNSNLRTARTSTAASAPQLLIALERSVPWVPDAPQQAAHGHLRAGVNMAPIHLRAARTGDAALGSEARLMHLSRSEIRASLSRLTMLRKIAEGPDGLALHERVEFRRLLSGLGLSESLAAAKGKV